MHKDNVFVQLFKGLLGFVLSVDVSLDAIIGVFGAIGISEVQSWDRWKVFYLVDFFVWSNGITFTDVWYDRTEL